MHSAHAKLCGLAAAGLLSAGLLAPVAARADEAPKPACPVCEKVRGVSMDLAAELAAAKALPRVSYRLGADGSRELVSFEELLDELSSASVVFLGEQHDDDATHRLQFEVLAELSACRNVALGMEQFERDVQSAVDAWLAGDGSEQSELDFLTVSRPWGNYQPDYRRLLHWSRSQGIPVLASNTPTPVVRMVSRKGWELAWAGYTAEQRAWLAQSSTHPEDQYWSLFKLAMGLTLEAEAALESGQAPDTSHGMGMTREMAWNFYLAQCLKDDTMAESIYLWLYRNPGGLVVHTNGRFHSDYRLGTASRTISRLQAIDSNAECSVRVVSFVPVQNLGSTGDFASEAWADLEGVGDYVVFVQAPPADTAAQQ
ncbi:ChaN family lipoprotein [bacterium]|nr:ChaN family lipoprotein [bacterium]